MPLLKYDGSAAALTAAPILSLSSVLGLTVLTGTAAHEEFWASNGERLVGGLGDDTYYFQHPKNSVVEWAGQGIDKIVGWSNIWLGKYADVENLSVGGDNVYGAGNNLDNIVEGQSGGQQLYGGRGQDVLIGGAGADVFIVVKGEGNDVVQDFNVAEDKLRLTAGFSTFDQLKAAMTQVGADVKIDFGSGEGLILRNTAVASFSASNFQLQLDASKLGARTFGDEFSGPLSLWDPESNPAGTWRPDFGYQGAQGVGSYSLVSNDEKQIYTSPYFRGHNGDFSESPFATGDGVLTITARPSTNPEIFGYGYTSGLISTQATFAQTYGYFEMRADLPEAAGAWPAFWLIPADGSWPPELDVMEALTSDPHGAWTTWHSANGGHSSKGILSFIPDTADGFHTYGVLWTATELVWYTDGVEMFRQATPSDMNKPMFMIANLALGGWGGAIDAAALPAQLKIDYIRAYGLGDGGAAAPPAATPPPASGYGATLTSSGYGATLTGGAGADTLIASNQGAETLTGGAGADIFRFTAVPWSPSHVKDFTVGTDRLDLSALLAGYSGADPIADGWLYLLDDGAGGTKVCVDTDGGAAGNPWPLYVTNLDGVSIQGLTAAKLMSPAVAPVTAPAVTPLANPGVTLTSKGWGDTLTGGSGNDTLVASNQGAEILRGGAGGDTFKFNAVPWSPSHVKDFAVGVDRLDLSALLAGYSGTDPVADGWLYLFDDGVGGTKVCVDTDGRATGNLWPQYVTNLDGVSVEDLTAAKLLGTAPQTASSPAIVVEAPRTLVSTRYGDVLTGGAGNDSLTAGEGPDSLTGGAGADRFAFDKLPWNAGHVTDFAHGTDTLDLSALLRSGGYTGGNPLADRWVEFRSDGAGNTQVYVDTDGAGGGYPTLVTTLDHVAAGTIDSGDWIWR